MNLIYIYSGDLNIDKASKYQSVDQCFSFSKSNLVQNLTVIHFGKKSKIFNKSDIKEINFNFSSLETFLKIIIYSIKNKKDTFVYSRSMLYSLPFLIGNKKIIMELHSNPKNHGIKYFLFYKICKFYKSVNFTSITKSLKNDLNLSNKRCKVVPDACSLRDYNLSKFLINASKPEHLSLGYIGSFAEGKGIEFLAKLSFFLPSYCKLYIAGGTKKEIENNKQKFNKKNTFFLGKISRSQISKFMDKIDVGLLPNLIKVFGLGKNKVDIGKYTSPLKLFEYMAFRKIILSSNLPVLREVLNNSNSYLSKANDIDDWLKNINEIFINQSNAKDKEFRMYTQYLKKHTLEIRTENIIGLFND